MPYHRKPTAQCQVCKADKPHRELLPAEFVRPTLLHLIEKEHADWKPDGFICVADLNRYRMACNASARVRVWLVSALSRWSPCSAPCAHCLAISLEVGSWESDWPPWPLSSPSEICPC